MELKFDTSKVYAVALEGGGAKGAYEAGVWKALEEAGVKYNAVAGTSVGALNGAMMASRDLNTALHLWENVSFSQVFDADDMQMKKIYDRDLEGLRILELLKDVVDIVKEGGLDIEPLRMMMLEYIDEERIRQSEVAFFFVTYSLTDRTEVEIDAHELEEGKLIDMLLASAYVPGFQRRKLDGKDYVDGSVQNVLPIDSLLKRGYRDIIMIRIYGLGLEKRTKIPEDANIITVAPREKLGGILQFDPESTRRDMTLGYYDGLRMLYGLAGERYYIDRQWSEMQAYFALKVLFEQLYLEKAASLREWNEKLLPRLAKKKRVKDGDYYDLLVQVLEELSDEVGLTPFSVRTEEGWIREIGEAYHKRKEQTEKEVLL
ncbi:MAG: patatin-like phospholipase family protein [Bacillota bacterium]|nr:patatin-like phospholipase family protein [Bacillota bacterium]